MIQLTATALAIGLLEMLGTIPGALAAVAAGDRAVSVQAVTMTSVTEN